jgi:hypothetical protein
MLRDKLHTKQQRKCEKKHLVESRQTTLYTHVLKVNTNFQPRKQLSKNLPNSTTVYHCIPLIVTFIVILLVNHRKNEKKIQNHFVLLIVNSNTVLLTRQSKLFYIHYSKNFIFDFQRYVEFC